MTHPNEELVVFLQSNEQWIGVISNPSKWQSLIDKGNLSEWMSLYDIEVSGMVLKMPSEEVVQQFVLKFC